MATGFKVAQIGDYAVDVDDILIRREYFNDGTLWGWGLNNVGQLGTNNISNYSSPVTTVGGGINWKQVSSSITQLNQSHTAGIKTDGTLWAWGYNGKGELGDGTATNRSSPVITAGGETNWKQVSCGYNYTAAIKTNGTLWTWGANWNGNLGDGTTTSRSSPGTTAGGGTNWKQVSCGSSHIAAIKTDGTLWVCGYNGKGGLGDGTTVGNSSPVTTAGGGTNWKQVSCGAWFTAAIKTDGTLWTWGYGSNGKIGNNTTSNYSSPITTAGGGSNWKQVFVGTNLNSVIAAIKTNGTLWAWGSNASGANGFGANASSPRTTAGGGSNWKQVSVGLNHTAAIKTDGTLWTWGGNNNGELGDGTNTSSFYYYSPRAVVAGTNWKHVACGDDVTLAITDLSI